MSINNIRDLHAKPFVVIPVKYAESPEEYILGYTGDQVDTLVESDEGNGDKVQIDTGDNENKVLLKCITRDDVKQDYNENYKSDVKNDYLKNGLIIKKKKKTPYCFDDKKIINHLLSKLPNKSKDLEDNLSIKKETNDKADNSILINLVPEIPSERKIQDFHKKSIPIKQMNKKTVCNPQSSPDIIQLDDDSMDTEGNYAELGHEELEPVVSKARSNPVAIQLDNAGVGPSLEQPIDCDSIASHNLDKQKVPAPKQLSSDSYCRMITKAILASPGRRISVKMLFWYISQNYPCFSKELDGWQIPIEKYLCRSKHFVKALPKNLAEGSTEMWMFNPATENKMIARLIRGLSCQKQVNHWGLDSHCKRHNFKSSTIESLFHTESAKMLHQDEILDPSQSCLNNKQRNFSNITTTDFTRPNNGETMESQRQTSTSQRKHVSDLPLTKSLYSMSQVQLRSPNCTEMISNVKNESNLNIKTLNTAPAALKYLFNQLDTIEKKKNEYLLSI